MVFKEKGKGTTCTCLICRRVMEWGWHLDIKIRDTMVVDHMCVSCYNDLMVLETKEW
jgi:hypothetical protein